MKLNLADCLKAVEGRQEFPVRRYDGLLVLNYSMALSDSFEGVREEFRGLTFEEATGRIVSRPFHKVFNINQVPKTQFEVIKDQDATVYEKLDGSMIHWFRHPNTGELTPSTRASPNTPQARSALRFARETHGLLDLIGEVVDSGYTPIFELVGPENYVIVQYQTERLVYLNSRHRETGDYVFDDRFPDKARSYDINLSDILGHLHHTEFEGYVCKLKSGLWAKAKTDWYRANYGVQNHFQRPLYKLYEMALDGLLDELYQTATPRQKEELDKITNEVGADFIKLRSELIRTCEEGVKVFPDRKEFAEWCRVFHPTLFTPFMLTYEGQEPKKYICKKLLAKYTEEKRGQLFVPT